MDVNNKKNNGLGSSQRKDKSSNTKLDSNKQFEFTEEKFLHSKKNFDFDSVVNNKDKNNEDDFESIFSNSNKNFSKNKPLIMNNINFKNISQINNNLVVNLTPSAKGINNMPNLSHSSGLTINNPQKDDINKNK